MDGLLIALVVAALTIGALLIIFIHFTSKRQPKLDQEAYRKVWQSILRGAETKTADSMQMAIIKADKLLDKAMRDYGVAGQTMGERLKARKGYWSSENSVWAVHKLRNQIAHDEKVSLTEQTFRRAMASYEKALNDLGAL